MTTNRTTPRRLHELYFGTEPDTYQSALYTAFPKVRGFSSATNDAERFRAVLVLALAQTIVQGSKETRETYLLVARPKEKWAIEQLQKFAGEIFARVKDGQRASEVAPYIGRCFKALRMGHLVLQLPGEPDRWVSFGFRRKDTIPDWMRSKLLERVAPNEEVLESNEEVLESNGRE